MQSFIITSQGHSNGNHIQSMFCTQPESNKQKKMQKWQFQHYDIVMSWNSNYNYLNLNVNLKEYIFGVYSAITMFIPLLDYKSLIVLQSDEKGNQCN